MLRTREPSLTPRRFSLTPLKTVVAVTAATTVAKHVRAWMAKKEFDTAKRARLRQQMDDHGRRATLTAAVGRRPRRRAAVRRHRVRAAPAADGSAPAPQDHGARRA